MPQGFAVETATSIEAVAAWVVPQTVLTATATAGTWYVLGEYYLPTTVSVSLDVTHQVSSALLTLQTRLWDVTDEAAVSNALVSTSSVPAVRTLSPAVELAGARRYQVQSRCYGSAGPEFFGAVQAATISD